MMSELYEIFVGGKFPSDWQQEPSSPSMRSQFLEGHCLNDLIAKGMGHVSPEYLVPPRTVSPRKSSTEDIKQGISQI